MVSFTFDEGIILAVNSTAHLIYSMDESIYCCASISGYDREVLREVATKLEDYSRDRGNKVTVAQTRDMLCKKYEHAESVEVLLAGQDAEGLHIYRLQSHGNYLKGQYVAIGAGAEKVLEYLEKSWKNDLSLGTAKKMVDEIVEITDKEMSGKSEGKRRTEVVVIFKRAEEEEAMAAESQIPD